MIKVRYPWQVNLVVDYPWTVQRGAGDVGRWGAGSDGGKGGQFASKDVAGTGQPVEVEIAIKHFRSMNRNRKKAATFLKRRGGDVNSLNSADRFTYDAMVNHYTKAKKRFETAQVKAESVGYAVNKLGKVRELPKPDVTANEALKQQAASVRKQLTTIQNDLEVKLFDIRTSDEYRGIKNGIADKMQESTRLNGLAWEALSQGNKSIHDKLFAQAKTLSDESMEMSRQLVQFGEQMESAKQTANQQIHGLLKVDNPGTMKAAKVSPTIKKDPKRYKALQEGIDFFNSVVSADVTKGVPAFNINAGGKGRSNALEEVNLTTSANTRTVVHELGHVLEHYNQGHLQKALDWHERRTAGEELTTMAKVTGNKGYREAAFRKTNAARYDLTEYTKPDKFTDPYIGKVYRHWEEEPSTLRVKTYRQTGKAYATEVTSMGVEQYFTDPGKLAKDDPDMFDFLYVTVRGGSY